MWEPEAPRGKLQSDLRRKRHAIKFHNWFSKKTVVHDDTHKNEDEAARFFGVLFKKHEVGGETVRLSVRHVFK